MDTVIKLENVWKVYYLGKVEVWALRGISLEIKKGTFLSIIGPSGSGKSTLLNIIGCLDFPTKGKVFLDGRDIQKLSSDELSRIRGKKIGFIFQQFNLLPNLTAIENVALPMIFQGVKEKERLKRARELLELVGLKERISHRPQELSGGEQQRVAIARALANDPEIVIADEPTGNLDSKSGEKIMEILKKLHKEQKRTILVVTHDPQIASYSEEILKIKDGKIMGEVSEKEILWRK
ncbi:MAG TPA: ABC transporter ATP-binding protein [bacterium]|nr:ABC transporter ATP-binding protein [bacterium]